MEAARGASLTSASFPKSSPSWRVQTTPCPGRHTDQLLGDESTSRSKQYNQFDVSRTNMISQEEITYFSIDDNIDWAL